MFNNQYVRNNGNNEKVYHCLKDLNEKAVNHFSLLITEKELKYFHLCDFDFHIL